MEGVELEDQSDLLPADEETSELLVTWFEPLCFLLNRRVHHDQVLLVGRQPAGSSQAQRQIYLQVRTDR